jgi:thiamine-monophosphate kinase
VKITDLGGEAALINLIRDKYGATGAGDLALGIGDDAALIRSGEQFLIVTADLLVENTHFRMDITEPYLLGWKSAAVNISDIAAMGGTPTYSFVSIGLPDIEVGIVEAIYEGMRDVSAQYGSVLAGGDTVASGAGIVINVTQLGTVEPDKVARRDGAKPGDAIIVTNTIGDSRAGLELLLKFGLPPLAPPYQGGEATVTPPYEGGEWGGRGSEPCVMRHLKPEPRVPEARAAVGTGKVHSMMDLSDGLAADLRKLCEASHVGSRVFASALPISEDLHIAAARLDLDAIHLAAGGGEDYELLLTCDSKAAPEIAKSIASTGSTARVIGEIIEGSDVTLVLPNGEEGPISGSWEHF